MDNILFALYWEFCKVGAFCIGGGYASMPWLQTALIDNTGWLTMNEFVDIFTISQMTPGPIGINAATFAGMKIAGLPGGIIATLGFVTFPMLICLTVIHLMNRYGDIAYIRGVLAGLRPAVVAFICAAGLSFIYLAIWNVEVLPESLSDYDSKGIIVLILAYVALRKKLFGTISLLAVSGAAGLLLGLAGL